MITPPASAPKISALTSRITPTIPSRPKTFLTTSRTTNEASWRNGRSKKVGHGPEGRCLHPGGEPIHVVGIAEGFQDGQAGLRLDRIADEQAALGVCPARVRHRADAIPDHERLCELGRVSIRE